LDWGMGGWMSEVFSLFRISCLEFSGWKSVSALSQGWRRGRMKCGAESQLAHVCRKAVFFAIARIIFRNLDYLGGGIAVPAVLANRRPACWHSAMEMRYPANGAGRSGHGLEQDAPATLRLPYPRLLEFRHGDAASGTERDAPGTVWRGTRQPLRQPLRRDF
jgi:hypothetical protein